MINATYPRISVIIACLNEERYIEKCINSILEQDYQGEFDIIIADGGSDDRTIDIISSIRSNNSKIILVDNPGIYQSGGRNIAISIADSTFVAYLDAHRIANKSWLSELWDCYSNFATNDEKIAGVGSVHYDAASNQFTKGQEIAFRNILSGATTSNFLNYTGPAKVDHACMMLYNKKIFVESGGFDERLQIGEDIELNHRLVYINGYNLYLNPKAVNYYYPRENFTTLLIQQYKYGLWRQEVFDILKEALKKKTDNPFQNKLRNMRLKTLIPGYFVIILLLMLAISMLSMPVFLISSAVVLAYILILIIASVMLGIKNKINPTIFTAVFVAIHFGYGFGVLSYFFKKVKGL